MIEDQVLRQRARIDWIKKGDGDNSFFHASIRTKNNQMGIYRLCRKDSITTIDRKEIKEEILDFYTSLMGTANTSLKGIDLETMRSEKQLSLDLEKSLEY